jgi:hypothetical protein
MEFVREITTGRLWFIPVIFIAVFSCKSGPETVHDPLVLQEIAPIPRTVRAGPVATEYEPVYSVMRIVEISEVNGVQKYILIRAGADRTGIDLDVAGDIGDDAAFQRVIGNFKIIEIHGNFIRCEIIELAYRIGPSAYVRIKIGEQLKEAASR